jgi:hypothetical protein
MDTLNSILQEELNRLKSLKENYEHELQKFPKGCFIEKKIKGNLYYYLNYRSGKKSVYKYLGKLDEKDVLLLKNKIEQRKKMKNLYIQTKKSIIKMEKIING